MAAKSLIISPPGTAGFYAPEDNINFDDTCLPVRDMHGVGNLKLPGDARRMKDVRMKDVRMKCEG